MKAVFGKAANQLSIELEDIKTTAIDDSKGSCSCSAQLAFKANGQQNIMPVVYYLQKAPGTKELHVIVQGLE